MREVLRHKSVEKVVMVDIDKVSCTYAMAGHAMSDVECAWALSGACWGHGLLQVQALLHATLTHATVRLSVCLNQGMDMLRVGLCRLSVTSAHSI